MTVTQTGPDMDPARKRRRCRHHWFIEMSNGAISRGICKRCQSVRRFHNSFDDLKAEAQARASFNATAHTRRQRTAS